MLIIRTAGIGDVAMIVHAVRMLRVSYPDLDITVATKPRMIPLFNSVERLDFIPVGKTFDLIKAAREQKVDLVADMRNELRGRIVRKLLALCGAKSRHYHQRRLERRPLLRIRNKKLYPLRSNVLRFCDVFASLGYPIDTPPFIERSPQPLPVSFTEPEGRWVGIAPFSQSRKKEYPLDLAEELVTKLCDEFDRVFVFSGPGIELEFAEEMKKRFQKVSTVFGRCDIAGEVALMSNLEVIITMDSSAMHMAALAGTPCISLWGSTHPYMGYTAWEKNAAQHHLQADLPCRPCCVYGEGKCNYGDIRCMRAISPQDIVDKIKKPDN